MNRGAVPVVPSGVPEGPCLLLGNKSLIDVVKRVLLGHFSALLQQVSLGKHSSRSHVG